MIEEAQAMLPSAQKQDEVGYVTLCSETRQGRILYLSQTGRGM